MSKKQPNRDRNFNGLSERFARNIYQTSKGQLRLAVLQRDFSALPTGLPLSVVDVGAGQGQFALWLATLGHQVTLTDISEEMLAQAQANAQQLAIPVTPHFKQCDLWSLGREMPSASVDLVCCHAVLEWLENPIAAIAEIGRLVRPGGWLSVLFYNVHGLIFKNLLRANYKRVIAGDIRGQCGSLTPINPLEPKVVMAEVAALGFEVVRHSGVRVFHDYILDPAHRDRDFASAMTLELQFSTLEPYRSLGRYVHLLAKKPAQVDCTMASPAGIEPASRP